MRFFLKNYNIFVKFARPESDLKYNTMEQSLDLSIQHYRLNNFTAPVILEETIKPCKIEIFSTKYDFLKKNKKNGIFQNLDELESDASLTKVSLSNKELFELNMNIRNNDNNDFNINIESFNQHNLTRHPNSSISSFLFYFIIMIIIGLFYLGLIILVKIL